jgi:hypothetical protein
MIRHGQRVERVAVRLACDMNEWLDRKARENLSNKNAEIARLVRAAMTREAREGKQG